jgi:lysophospholipase L1-like esterase
MPDTRPLAQNKSGFLPKNYLNAWPSYQGCQIFGGRMANQYAGDKTFEFAYELPCAALDVSGVQFIFANSLAASAGSGGMIINAKAIGSFADLDGAWSGATSVTFLGGQTQLRPAESSSRRAFEISDPTYLTPVARTDGGTRALVACRIYHGSGLNIMGLGNGADDFSNWATRPSGAARMRVNSASGDQRTATTGWLNALTSPCIGMAYFTRKPTVQVASFGDSITDGRGSYLQANFTLLATERLNADDLKLQFSHSDLGWSGQSMVAIRNNMRDAFEAGIVPDVAVFPCSSPNNFSSGTISAAAIQIVRSAFIDMLGLCAQYRVTPLVWTQFPVNAAVKDWGASDSLRVAYNQEIVSYCAANDIICVDLAPTLSGVTTNGQVQMLAGTTSDGIHPNDNGNALCMPQIKAALQLITRGLY